MTARPASAIGSVWRWNNATPSSISANRMKSMGMPSTSMGSVMALEGERPFRVNSRLQAVIKPCPLYPPQSRHREFATTCLFRAIGDRTQRSKRGNVGVVQRGGKHRPIDAEGARDQGMRAMTVPAAIDAGYEGGDELALTGRQRRGPAHQALSVRA